MCDRVQRRWHELAAIDTWNRTTATGAPERGRRTLLDGRSGFFLPGEEEMFVSNVVYSPPAD